jgi:7-dehydrocholesterol reductase
MWKFIRHPNYLGVLILTYAMCGLCGTDALLPWTEAIFATVFLVFRCLKDESKCARKYGGAWELYCKRVRWRLVPGLY